MIIDHARPSATVEPDEYDEGEDTPAEVDDGCEECSDGCDDEAGPMSIEEGAARYRQFVVLERRQRARRVIRMYSLGSAAIGFLPIPSPDLPILGSLEARMIWDIARIYNPTASQGELAQIAAIVSAGGYALRFAARRGRKRFPALGWMVNAGVAWLGVRGIGEAAIRWCERRYPLPI